MVLGWKTLLGHMLNQDPCTWIEAIKFIQGLKIPLFLTGLTLLHTIINLVFANIVKSPEPKDVADWIYANTGYGAFEGLQIQGYNISAQWQKTV